MEVKSEQADRVKQANRGDDALAFGFADLMTALWRGKVTIISVTAIAGVMSVLFSLSLPNQYKATAILAPAQSDSGGLTSVMGQLGGLASLAGVNLSSGSLTESDIAQRVMTSWSFVETFIYDNGLEVDLFASKDWDPVSDKLLLDKDVYDYEAMEWSYINKDGAKSSPTSWELYEVFRERLSVIADSESGLVSVSIEFFSPNLAKRWLEAYILAINSHMQKRQISRVEGNLKYLKRQVSQTPLAELQGAFYAIMEEQIKSQMLAEASPEYVFLTVSPAMTPEEKSGPKRLLICVLGTLLGVLASGLWVIVRDLARVGMLSSKIYK